MKRLTALFLAIAVAAATPAAGQECNGGADDDPLCTLPREVREAIRAGGDRADREYRTDRGDGDGDGDGGDGDKPRDPCELAFKKE